MAGLVGGGGGAEDGHVKVAEVVLAGACDDSRHGLFNQSFRLLHHISAACYF